MNILLFLSFCCMYRFPDFVQKTFYNMLLVVRTHILDELYDFETEDR